MVQNSTLDAGKASSSSAAERHISIMPSVASVGPLQGQGPAPDLDLCQDRQLD